jgi:hypothetical protein
MCSLLRDADRTRHTAAAGIAEAMVAHHAVTTRERRLLQKGLEPIGEDPGMHQRDRFPGSPYFVLKFDTVKSCAIQGLFAPTTVIRVSCVSPPELVTRSRMRMPNALRLFMLIASLYV